MQMYQLGLKHFKVNPMLTFVPTWNTIRPSGIDQQYTNKSLCKHRINFDLSVSVKQTKKHRFFDQAYQ